MVKEMPFPTDDSLAAHERVRWYLRAADQWNDSWESL